MKLAFVLIKHVSSNVEATLAIARFRHKTQTGLGLPALFRINRMQHEVVTHPEALSMPEEQEWQNKGQRETNDDKECNRLLGQSQDDSQRYRHERYQQFGHNKVDRYRPRPVTFFALVAPSAHGTFFIHGEAPAEELAFAAIGTA